jgi:hypothetical protein
MKMAIRNVMSWIVLCALLWWVWPQGLWEKVPGTGTVQETKGEGEWVIKWRGRADPAFFRETEVLHRSRPEGLSELMLVRVRRGVNVETWERRWSGHRDVEFLHPNFPYELERVDRVEEKTEIGENFYYLKRIGADRAWELARRKRLPRGLPRPVVVAVVDTGVDLDHPVLKPLLVPGVNVKNRLSPPQDEMGHGTRVAGVVAAVWGAFSGRNGAEIGRIMPVKVMENGNDGEIYYTVEGMREAIRRGADIIVLAQGSWTYSELMVQAVREAEAKGVLVVGAAGNAVYGPDGGIVYDRPLYYPAAIPEVLSVGSVRRDGTHEPSSNSGPGIDLAAPGELIHTAGLSREIDIDSGTSYAAPQVAGVAAMVWQTRPMLKPAQLRSLLCQTAVKPAGQPRWDEQMGYGVVNAVRALESPLLPDRFEPNDRPDDAYPISTGQEMSGVLEPGEEDWFRLSLKNPGTLSLKVAGSSPGVMRLRAVLPSGKSVESDPAVKPFRLTLPSGVVRIGLSGSGDPSRRVSYRITAEYALAPDSFENNDEPWQASLLPVTLGVTAYEATLHRQKDSDWYKLVLPSGGEMEIRVDPLSPRFDPVIYLLSGGTWSGGKIDAGNEGETERAVFPVREETLFFRVTDYGGNRGDVPYRLFIRYRASEGGFPDPGSVSPGAVQVRSGQKVTGRIRDAADIDWYAFDVPREGSFQMVLEAPSGWSGVEWALYDRQLRARDSWSGAIPSGGKKRWRWVLQPGRHYLRIRTVDQGDVPYRLAVVTEKVGK